MLNAIFIVGGEEVVAQAMLKLGDRRVETNIQKLATVSRLLEEGGARLSSFRLEKCSAYLKKKMDKKGAAFESLVAVEDGVWLVHLESLEVNHLVVVDSARRLIMDNEEKYPVKLSVDNLKACGGPDRGLAGL